MKLKLRYTAFLVICGLFLMSSFVFAQSDSTKNNSINFPELEGWEEGDITTYPTAELGHSISYQSKTGGTVTIYVYNGGNKKIADGIDDQNVKSEIKKAENDIKASGEAGYYQDVKVITNATIILGGSGGTRKALYTLLSFKVRGADVDSEIYLFGYQNNFIKIRATRPKGKNGADNQDVNKLLLEIGKIFSGNSTK